MAAIRCGKFWVEPRAEFADEVGQHAVVVPGGVNPAFEPGVFLCNRPLSATNPSLEDLAPAILTAFGVPVPEAMTG